MQAQGSEGEVRREVRKAELWCSVMGRVSVTATISVTVATIFHSVTTKNRLLSSMFTHHTWFSRRITKRNCISESPRVKERKGMHVPYFYLISQFPLNSIHLKGSKLPPLPRYHYLAVWQSLRKAITTLLCVKF